MASIGKGRGWAKAAEREVVLRRPGQSNSPKTAELEEIIDTIYGLSIEELSNKRCKELIAYIESIDYDNSDHFEKLWEQALEDRGFAIKFAKFSLPNIGGTLSLRHFYNNLQACYERREELRKENPLHLTNVTWMVAVAFSMSVSKKTKFHLGQAILDCMSLLLDSGIEDDTETVAILLYLYARDIRAAIDCDKWGGGDTKDHVGLSGVVNKARYMHINRNVSPRSRTLSLLIIDLANGSYKPFEGELQQFYATLLAPSRIPENDAAFSTGREFDQKLYLYRLLSKGMKTEKRASEPSNPAADEKPEAPQTTQKENRNEEASGPVPRAIRGAGASSISSEHKNGEESPRGQREKRADKPMYSSKRNTNKAWEHDDRFDTNYE